MGSNARTHYEAGAEPVQLCIGGGRREKVKNTKQLREQVFRIVDEIRAARKQINQPLQGVQTLAQCRACGQRGNCDQAVLS